MTRLRCERGFTLLDVMQASVLSTMALVGISSLLFATVHSNTRGRDITTAATLAEAKIEELRTLPFASLASGSDTVTTTEVPYTRSWIIDAGPTTGTVAVRVLIEWAAQGRSGVDLQTIINE